MKQEKKIFVTVDKIPYTLRVKPFDFNDQVRFEVSVNGGEVDVFAWDTQMNMYQSLSENTTTLPDALMVTINEKLLEIRSLATLLTGIPPIDLGTGITLLTNLRKEGAHWENRDDLASV